MPRATATITTPTAAERTPTRRIRSAGVCAASVIARRTASGKAANRRPSTARARPRAAIRSRMKGGSPRRAAGDPASGASARTRRGRAAGPGRGGRRRGRAVAETPVRIVEVAEEVRVGGEHHAGVPSLQARLVGLHGAVEGEEVRIAPKGLGEDAVLLRIAGAAQLLRAAIGVGEDDGRFALGAGP